MATSLYAIAIAPMGRHALHFPLVAIPNDGTNATLGSDKVQALREVARQALSASGLQVLGFVTDGDSRMRYAEERACTTLGHRATPHAVPCCGCMAGAWQMRLHLSLVSRRCSKLPSMADAAAQPLADPAWGACLRLNGCGTGRRRCACAPGLAARPSMLATWAWSTRCWRCGCRSRPMVTSSSSPLTGCTSRGA
jgi:hypothetical protein